MWQNRKGPLKASKIKTHHSTKCFLFSGASGLSKWIDWVSVTLLDWFCLLPQRKRFISTSTKLIHYLVWLMQHLSPFVAGNLYPIVDRAPELLLGAYREYPTTAHTNKHNLQCVRLAVVFTLLISRALTPKQCDPPCWFSACHFARPPCLQEGSRQSSSAPHYSNQPFRYSFRCGPWKPQFSGIPWVFRQ